MSTLPIALINHNFPPYLNAHRSKLSSILWGRGVVLNVIAVYRRDGEDKWSVANGFHRLKAHQVLGRSEIEVEVIGAPIPPGARSGKPLR